MEFGKDFVIVPFQPRHHGNHRGDHGPPRQKLKSIRLDVQSKSMRNRYGCDLTTPEGKREYDKLYKRDLRAKSGLYQKAILNLTMTLEKLPRK